MIKFLYVFFIFIVYDISSQTVITSQGLGVEGYFGASNQSGSFGIGPKFGFILNEKCIRCTRVDEGEDAQPCRGFP